MSDVCGNRRRGRRGSLGEREVKYRTIVADPPWPYEWTPTKRRQETTGATTVHRAMPYPTMSITAIQALSVPKVADADCRLFCWTTTRYLPDTFAIVTGWGFSYRQMVVWEKRRRGVFHANVSANNLEFVIVATRGNPRTLTRWPSGVLKLPQPYSTGPNHGPLHSAKPEAFLDLVEQVSPGPYLELFARRQRLGWDTWGNEALNHVELSA